MNQRIQELIRQSVVPADQAESYALAKGLIEPAEKLDVAKFAELIVSDYAKQLVQANMTNHWYVQAMDEYYENKWAHRFD